MRSNARSSRARRFAIAAGLTAGAWTAAGATPPLEAQEAETYRLSDRQVAIYNLAGRVQLVHGEGDAVVVEVRRGGADGERLSVEMGRIDGREALRVIYPADRIVYPLGRGRSRTDVRVRSDGTFSGESGGLLRFWSGGDRVRVSTYGGGLEAHADLRIQVPRDRELEVQLALGELTAEGLRADLRARTASGRIRAAEHRGRLDVDTGSGRIEVEGVEGEVSLDTGSGSVRVSEVRGPALTVDTGSGSVRGEGIRVDRLEVDTGSGAIELDRLAAPNVILDTGSGSVRLGLLSDVDHLGVDTGSGSVELRVPAELGAALQVDTGSGGISVDMPVRVRVDRRGRFEGIVGDGEGTIMIDTGSGGVRVRDGETARRGRAQEG